MKTVIHKKKKKRQFINFATVESGLIKGLLTHTNNRQILARREKYIMDVRAQYKVEDQDSSNGQSLFEFNTDVVRVTFIHPIKISIVNKLNKKITIGPGQDGQLRGPQGSCECPISSGGQGISIDF